MSSLFRAACDVSGLFVLPPPPPFCQPVSFSVLPPPPTPHTARPRQVGVVFWVSAGLGGGEAGGGRCRLTFTPGERWELWEQSVLVCWRRPACSVLHAWVWARGTEGVGLRICQRREGKKVKISATEDTWWTSRANDWEKAVVCVLVAS